MRILVVEDVDTMRELMGQLVGLLKDCSVSGLAQNGAEARLELSRRRPDLIFLDEILPGESSVDLLEEFKREGIPVVLITSLEERNAPLPDGALSRIFKPGWKTLKKDALRFQTELDKIGANRG